ncbi:MAG TPA: hypothetical protein VGL53_18000 [Bryobacteraceae bacterium]|jgi:hypothetical protein
MTVVDRLDVGEDARNREVWAEAIRANSRGRVVWTMDTGRWKAQLFDALRR